MKDFASVKARYLRDPIPVRLGGLAADLARIGSASANAANGEAVHVLLEETRRFIEWTAAELNVDVAGEVVDLNCRWHFWFVDPMTKKGKPSCLPTSYSVPMCGGVTP